MVTVRLSRVPLDKALAARALPIVLSLIGGSTDVISFVGLGLFTAHITGNIVILAAHAVTDRTGTVAEILSVPVFMLGLGFTRSLAIGLERVRIATLRPLLALEFLLLCGFLALSVAAGPHIDPNAPTAILAGMLGVCAMAAQNALAQISLKGVPSTAVMTTNVTRFMSDATDVLLRHGDAATRARANRTWPVIVGFTVGCALGAVCEAAFGLWSLTLPVALALVSIALSAVAGL